MDWLTPGCHQKRDEVVQIIALHLFSEALGEGMGDVATMQRLPDLKRLADASDPAPETVEPNLEQTAFPTEERMLQKKKEQERKDRGEPSTRGTRKQFVEDHHDDCGCDLSGLGDDVELETTSMFLNGLPLFTQHSATAQIFDNLDDAIAYMARKPPGLDIVELCGGEARCTQIAMRRGLSAGDNFDLKCNCDLNNSVNQDKVLEYIRSVKPLVAVMAPTCTPYGPMANLVKHVTPASWKRSLDLARPHGRFCGRVAQLMQRLGKYFIAEQPHPSNLWREPEWLAVQRHPCTIKLVIHQCMAGQTGPSGMPAKKPTSLMANHVKLLEHLPALKGPQNCITLNWNMANADQMLTHHSSDTRMNVLKIFGEQESCFGSMQCVLADLDSGVILEDATDASPSIIADSGLDDMNEVHSHGRLSTIPEESVSASATSPAAEVLFALHFQDAPDDVKADLLELCEFVANEDEDIGPPEMYEMPSMPYEEFDRHAEWTEESLAYATSHSTLDTSEVNENGVPYIEVYITRDMAAWMCDTYTDEPHVMKIYASEEIKREVIRRETDIATPSEMIEHKDLMDTATIAEYKTWLKYQCFERIPKSEAKVLIDARFVAKWKFVDGVRTIRMRMALRGFK